MGRAYLIPFDRRVSPAFSSTVSRMFRLYVYLQMCGGQGLVPSLEADASHSASNFSNIITVNVGFTSRSCTNVNLFSD